MVVVCGVVFCPLTPLLNQALEAREVREEREIGSASMSDCI